MKNLAIILGVPLTILSFLCSCGNRTNIITELDVEERILPSSAVPYEPEIRDTVVNLSFAGYSLGSTADLSKADVNWQSTITKDRLAERIVYKDLVLEGDRVNVKLDIITLYDTICRIVGIINRDVYYALVETYAAKYENPTSGELKDSYKTDTGTRHTWRFRNQSIELERNARYDWNLDARPMRKEYFFDEIIIWYTDYELYDRYSSVRADQKEYERRMKPVTDSIEAAKAKAVQDSLHEVEHQRRLKDAHQI